MTKKEIFAQTLLHRVKQRNKTGVVEKLYTVDVLTVHRTYLPENYKRSFKFAEIVVKYMLASFFVDTVSVRTNPGDQHCSQNGSLIVFTGPQWSGSRLGRIAEFFDLNGSSVNTQQEIPMQFENKPHRRSRILPHTLHCAAPFPTRKLLCLEVRTILLNTGSSSISSKAGSGINILYLRTGPITTCAFYTIMQIDHTSRDGSFSSLITTCQLRAPSHFSGIFPSPQK